MMTYMFVDSLGLFKYSGSDKIVRVNEVGRKGMKRNKQIMDIIFKSVYLPVNFMPREKER